MKLFSIIALFLLLFIQDGSSKNVSLSDDISSEFVILELTEDDFHTILNADSIDEILIKCIVLNQESKIFIRSGEIDASITSKLTFQNQQLLQSSDLSPPANFI